MSSIPRKVLSQIFIVLSLLALASLLIKFMSSPLSQFLGYSDKSGVNITAIPQARVLVDGIELGETPFVKEDLLVGQRLIRLESKTAVWQATIKLEKGVVTTINRELASFTASSSGEILSLHKGRGVNITSVPINAKVEIDGMFVGNTPLMTDQVIFGEHTFFLSAKGYISRQIKASIPEGYLLNIQADLAISPTSSNALNSSTITILQKGLVKDTGVGFLRVREAPSLNSKELARIKTGESLLILAELESWLKVRLEDNTEGFVSAEFIQIID